MLETGLLERGVDRILLPSPESDRLLFRFDFGVVDGVFGLRCFGVNGTLVLTSILLFVPGVTTDWAGLGSFGVNLGVVAEDFAAGNVGFMEGLAGVSSNTFGSSSI